MVISIPERSARQGDEKSANSVSLLPSVLFAALRYKQLCEKNAIERYFHFSSFYFQMDAVLRM
jgi:hypothetical protein